MKKTIKPFVYSILLLVIILPYKSETQEYQHVYDLQYSTQLALANTKCEDHRMAFVGYYLPDRNGEETPNGHTFVMKTEENGSKVWERRYSFDNGDLYPTDITYTDDEGFIISGQIYLNNGSSKGFLLKINEDGTQNWLRSYENNYTSISVYNYSGNQALEHVEQDFGGNYITIGTSYGSNPYKVNFILVDGSGMVKKNKAYTYTDLPMELKIKPLEDGSYLAIGSFTEDSHVWLLDADLNIIWEKRISIAASSSYFWSRDLVIHEGNRFVITGGSTTEQHSGGNSIIDYYTFLIQMDFSGNKLWEHSYRWYNQASDAIGMSIGNDDGGNLFVGGSFQNATLIGYDQYGDPVYSYDNQAFVLKTTQSGNAMWVGDYGKSNTYESALDIIVHNPGEWVAVGDRGGVGNNHTYIMKGNPDGDTPCDMDLHFPTDTTLNYQITTVNSSSVFHIVATLDHQDLSQGFNNLGSDCNGQQVQLQIPEGEDAYLRAHLVKKLGKEGLHVFPNPSRGSFTLNLVNGTVSGEARVEFYRIDGQLISKHQMKGHKQKFHGFNPGSYIVRVIDGDQPSTQKVVVR